MIDALPAFAGVLVNSVIAPFVRPPPSAASKESKPVTSRFVGGNAFCGKRSARSLRRSMILPVAMPEHDTRIVYVQKNIFQSVVLSRADGEGPHNCNPRRPLQSTRRLQL